MVAGRGFCVPCPPAGGPARPRECRSLAGWVESAVWPGLSETELRAWLPSPVGRLGAQTELRVCRGPLCATDEPGPGFGPQRCRYEEPVLRGLVPAVQTCGPEAGCCVAYRRRGRDGGGWVGLGCESCLPGLGRSASLAEWLGGGGGRRLPVPWDGGSELCLWRTQYCVVRGSGGATEAASVGECGRAEQCCRTSPDGAKGCARCPARLRLLRCLRPDRCLCRGALCNARHPRLFPNNSLPN